MVNFLITEVDHEGHQEEDVRAGSSLSLPFSSDPDEGVLVVHGGALSSSSSASALLPPDRSKSEASVALPMISIYRVEDAELPAEATSDTVSFAPANLPDAIPEATVDKVMTNIVQNLDFKAWSGHARQMWFKDFNLPPSRAFICDMFWFCICHYFKSGKHKDVEKRLYDRISANFVFLFEQIGAARKDLFFRFYADAAAQAVLYSMFLAYPKSRVNFTEQFRRNLVTHISYWTTGVSPEFVDTAHWKLNLGGGDVLQATGSPAWQRGGEGAPGGAAAGVGSQGMTQLSADSLAGRRASLAHRAQRPFRTLWYSPLVAHFLKTRKFSSVNFVRPLRMGLTTAEERCKLMDVKHAMLVERANTARKHCDQLSNEYIAVCAEVKREKKQHQAQAQAAKKRLEIRRKEVLRSDPHEYANYLVSLHLLQQGLGQNA